MILFDLHNASSNFDKDGLLMYKLCTMSRYYVSCKPEHDTTFLHRGETKLADRGFYWKTVCCWSFVQIHSSSANEKHGLT